MANYATVNDLRADALWRAGEPQDSSSSFWDMSLTYLNKVQQILLMGGGVAVGRDLATSAGIYAHLVDLPITDWWWARKVGIIVTTAQVDATITTLATSATSVTLSGNVTPSVAGRYLVIPGVSTVSKITAHTSGTAALTLDAEWPEEAQDGKACRLVSLEYDLPSDFLRFAAPPYVHHTFASSIPVSSSETRDMVYPLASLRQGVPTAAFQLGPQQIGLNVYDARRYRLQFEYIYKPSDLAVDGTPLLPEHHRQVLAIGAAMLMAFDKGDDRARSLASEYREGVRAMLQEHRRGMSGGSQHYGQFKVRQPMFARRSPQTNGELFLI